jgi:predicted alpha/beta hydrolase family esterase
MKNALILHGAGNDHTGNWFPWLNDELKKKDYKVWVPDLPNSDVPNLKDWLETVFSNKEWKFDKESIIVGHSAGATFILRILEKLSVGIKIHKAILVSGPAQMGKISDYFPYKREMVTPPFDWDKIKNSCEKFYFVYSDNDKYQCGEENSKIFQEYLGGELILKKGQGHFNLEVGPEYKQFPLLVKLIEL